MKVIEGTWEEVLHHAQELQGKRVRVIVLDAPSREQDETTQRLQAFRELIASFRQNPPPGTVSEEALRRENLYEERI
jgi:hypothetical protein